MSLTVTCPEFWKAVSNSIETCYPSAKTAGKKVLERHGIEWFLDFYEDADNVTLYEYEQTPRISPYLYAICAGPYTVFEDFDPMYVPQRVFVRKSLVENLRHELIFGVTKTTLDFY